MQQVEERSQQNDASKTPQGKQLWQQRRRVVDAYYHLVVEGVIKMGENKDCRNKIREKVNWKWKRTKKSEVQGPGLVVARPGSVSREEHKVRGPGLVVARPGLVSEETREARDPGLVVARPGSVGGEKQKVRSPGLVVARPGQLS